MKNLINYITKAFKAYFNACARLYPTGIMPC